jgi:hypothetical protein
MTPSSGHGWEPRRVAALDQDLAAARKALQELVDTYREAVDQAGDIKALTALTVTLAALDRTTLIAIGIAAVTRIHNQQAGGS